MHFCGTGLNKFQWSGLVAMHGSAQRGGQRNSKRRHSGQLTEVVGSAPGVHGGDQRFHISGDRGDCRNQMAAILRASVRRAMVGLMPLASEAW